MPLRHPSRVYSVWVNGNEDYYFNATPDQINEILDLYSKARLRDHEVKIETGKQTVSEIIGQRKADYNVKMQVLSGIALFMDTNNDRANSTLEPNLTIYMDEQGTLLKQLKFPENVIVTSTVKIGDLKAKRALPARKSLFGKVQFDDGDASNGMDRGVSTRITFWEKDQPDGIEIAQVGRDGVFRVVLSEDELAQIKKGDAWLTTTTGNFRSVAKKDGSKFPLDALTAEREKAPAQKIPAPKYYYGRILFDDGKPAILDPKPWEGAEIFLSFSYAGNMHLDKDGYFQLFLEPEQLDELIKQGDRANVYVPEQEQGRGSARETFPPGILSQDKSKAGEIKIARPVYEKAQ